MIGNEVSRWVLSALFAGLGAWYLAAAGRELFPLGRRRRLVPAVGTGLQAVMCAVMIGMAWPWGAGIPAIAQVTVFTAGGGWFVGQALFGARTGAASVGEPAREIARRAGRGTRCELVPRDRWVPCPVWRRPPAGARRRLVASAALTGGFLIAGLVFAGSASAHVKVSGVDAVQGGSGVITFRVPSESDAASTTGLLITFPAATPFTSVDVQPKAGWAAKVTKKPLPDPLTDDDGGTITDYVAQVDFTATGSGAGAGIPPGEFDMFNLSVGPFPKAPNMTFAALQTYSDGSTVNWDEKSANGVVPDHPAPVLQLAAAAGAQPATASQTGASQTGVSQTGAGSSASGGSSSWIGITGLIAGLAALVVAVAALVTARSRGRAAPPA